MKKTMQDIEDHRIQHHKTDLNIISDLGLVHVVCSKPRSENDLSSSAIHFTVAIFVEWIWHVGASQNRNEVTPNAKNLLLCICKPTCA
jgi:hypothetical protein